MLLFNYIGLWTIEPLFIWFTPTFTVHVYTYSEAAVGLTTTFVYTQRFSFFLNVKIPHLDSFTCKTNMKFQRIKTHNSSQSQPIICTCYCKTHNSSQIQSILCTCYCKTHNSSQSQSSILCTCYCKTHTSSQSQSILCTCYCKTHTTHT